MMATAATPRGWRVRGIEASRPRPRAPLVRQRGAAGRRWTQPCGASDGGGEGGASEADLELILWTARRGATGHYGDAQAVCVSSGPSGRGLFAVRDIAEGEVVYRAPLGPSSGALNSLLEAQPYEAAPWGPTLAASLVRARRAGEDSPLAAYVASLPQRVGTPLHWAWEGLEEVQYAPLLDELHYFGWLTAESGRMSGVVVAAEDNDNDHAEEWADAMSVVHSRAFLLDFGGGEDGPWAVGRCLVPFADLFNHGEDASRRGAAWRVSSDGAGGTKLVLEFFATRNLERGEEVTVSYGDRPNDDFLGYYGFLPASNAHDLAEVFDDVEHAAEWWLANVEGMDEADEGTEARAEQAVERGLEAAREIPVDERPYMPTRSSGGGGLMGDEGGAPCWVQTRGRADPAVLATFVSLFASHPCGVGLVPEHFEAPLRGLPEGSPERALGAAKLAVAWRCQEVEGEVPGLGNTTLERDLRTLGGAFHVSAVNGALDPASVPLKKSQKQRKHEKADAGVGGEKPAPLAPELELAVRFRAAKKALLREAMTCLQHQVDDLIKKGS